MKYFKLKFNKKKQAIIETNDHLNASIFFDFFFKKIMIYNTSKLESEFSESLIEDLEKKHMDISTLIFEINSNSLEPLKNIRKIKSGVSVGYLRHEHLMTIYDDGLRHISQTIISRLYKSDTFQKREKLTGDYFYDYNLTDDFSTKFEDAGYNLNTLYIRIKIL